jgi:exonuclease VII small subunit
MDSQSQAVLSRLEAKSAALEHAVQSYEQAIERAEQCIDTLAQADAAQDEASLQPIMQALQDGQEAAALVNAANAALDDALLDASTSVPTMALTPVSDYLPLPNGTLICDERYRLVHLLHRRPRVHLYLARRMDDLPAATSAKQSLVAVREIVLAGLSAEERRSVIRAAFEEFAAPNLFGSPHLPGVGDHLYIEGDRHYLIMQPRPVRGNRPVFAAPLSELQPGQPGSPSISTWPDLPTALHLGIQLCRVVARLHSMQMILGELTPNMILINRAGGSDWAPLLLAAWPPAPRFWPGRDEQATRQFYEHIFPPIDFTVSSSQGPDLSTTRRAFTAPEALHGNCDERSDIYALGAILYLLFTGSAPVTSQSPLDNRQTKKAARRSRKAGSKRERSTQQETPQDQALIPPHLLNQRISPLLEQIILRALAPDPEQRFSSARDLVEALEGTHLKTDTPLPPARISRLKRLLEWLKR